MTAQPVQDSDQIKQLLVQQLYSPVLWEDSIRQMLREGVDTFIEIGPGKVLTGLVRKIDRNVNTFSVYDIASLENSIQQLKGGSL